MEIKSYFEVNPGKKGARNVSISLDGEFLIANCCDKKIKKYPLSSIVEKKKPRAATLDCTLGSPGGLDLKGNILAAADETGNVEVRDLNKDSIIASFNFNRRYINKVLISPVDNNIIAVSAYKFFAIYDCSKGLEICNKSEIIKSFDFLADGSVMVSGYQYLKVISVIDGKEKDYDTDIKGDFFGIFTSADFKYTILLNTDDCYFELIDNSANERKWTQKDEETLSDSGGFFDLTFSKDSKFFAIACGEYISVWDIDNKTLAAKYETEDIMNESISSSSDFKYIAVTGQFSPISVFELSK